MSIGKTSCCTAVLWVSLFFFFLLKQVLLAGSVALGLLTPQASQTHNCFGKYNSIKVTWNHFFLLGGEKVGERLHKVRCSSSTMCLTLNLGDVYHANPFTFIYSTVTFSYSCVNLHGPHGRSFAALYVVQMQSNDQSLSQNTHIASKEGDWRQGKMSRQKNNRSQGNLHPELLNQVICSTEILSVWHPDHTAITIWSRTTLDPCFKTKIPPSPKELN